MKRIKLFISVLVLSVSSLSVLVVPQALAATKTWAGTAGDHKFSTAGNWSPSGAPSNGDALVFPNTASDLAPDNDISSASFASITFSGAGTSGVTVSGNAFTLTGGITDSTTQYDTITAPIALSGSQTFSTGAGSSLLINGVVSGSGNLAKTGTGALYLGGNNASYSGSITASAGTLNVSHNNALGDTTGTTTINDGADLALASCSDMTVNENITVTGASSDTTNKAKVIAGGSCAGGASDETYGTSAPDQTMILGGTITLGSNITFAPFARVSKITGTLSGNFSISTVSGYAGQLVVQSTANTSATSNGTYDAAVLSKTLSDDQPAHTVAIFGKTIVTIDGKRGDTTIGSGATLKGTGSVGALSVVSGGTVAPGHSPGCLVVGGGLTLAGALDEEIGGTTACSGYDQLQVTGTVNLTNASLNTSLYNNFKPAVGQKYTIISNDASDAVTGTFQTLAEGATFTVSGVVFKISYVGGDGNDVVLTVQTVPAAPNTGMALIKNNPLASMLTMFVAAGGVVVAAKYGRRPASKRR
jgi:fibronectin-binding autotransporter adhesin